MRKLKLLMSMFLALNNVAVHKAQDVALFRTATKCIFLKSDENLYTDDLIYYNTGKSLVNLIRIEGFPIKNNLSIDEKGKQFLKLFFYNGSLKNPSEHHMNINLYFDKIPDTVNYYLYVPKFRPGFSIKVVIPSMSGKKVTMNIPGKGKPILDSHDGIAWPPTPLYDITNIVFPKHDVNKDK